MKRLFFCAFITALHATALATTYTVTKTVDDGSTGTLRWAINQANANAGYDVIAFNIAVAGNTFESSGVNNWAVITVLSALPVITETVLIDGTTQLNTNIGSITGKTVGVDAWVQPNINYPDVYIVCGYTLPNTESSLTGNGLFINAVNVTVRGVAISGFGCTSTNQATAVGHGDISIAYSATARNANTVISDCFISCDPRGAVPSTTARRSKSGGLLILGNNNGGTAQRNYIAHPGGYGIVFHGTVDNTSSTPNLTPSLNWLVQDNQIENIGTSTVYTGGKAADAISMLGVRKTQILYNYVNNWEQFGIDVGHNADSNRIENNTLTGFTKTSGSAPCGAIRTAFSSQRDSLIKNVIYNNTSTVNLAGIWTDETQTTFAGGIIKNDSLFYYAQNQIYNNRNSGIVLSTNGTGTVTNVTITQNSIYDNSGLGIDLNFTDLTGATAVSVNDDNDGDTGPNDVQNFPVIDSAKLNSSNLYIWGKAPIGSTVEFFIKDGQINNHGSRILSYGEGKTYVGTGIEGSAQDLATGLGSYNLDGNVATNNTGLFYFVLPYAGFIPTDSITATATLNRNTSEFGPKAINLTILDCHLLRFAGTHLANSNQLSWTALCDKNFSHFVVEVSTDARIFTTAQTVYVTKTDSTKFSFTHAVAAGQTRYYRLRMISADGSSRYSQVVRLGAETSAQDFALRCLQNPVINYLTLEIESTIATSAEVTIVNAAGNSVANRQINLQVGANRLAFDNLNGLAKGWYQATVLVHGKRLTVAVVKD